MDLFEHVNRAKELEQTPLAARMRPRTLDEFVGQDAIVGPGRLLRRAIQADQLSSLLLYGPPGTGKTTLAQIIANTTRAHFIALNAVLSGVKDIRASVNEATQRRKDLAERTILFVDEVHRFNKAQQDALLPWVENGTVILIGATTENPYFEVNKALVSRSRIFQLKSLDEAALYKVARQALSNPERGYGNRNIEMDNDALEHLVNIANGDARTLLNALELAVETTQPDDSGVLRIGLSVAEESIQRRALLYDKEGDAHFDTISAFIKSIRGSDPDAALYWLARMIYAGEEPRYIFRRLLIAASEDIGLADPRAISVVESCASAFDRVGMPEGQFPLAQATLHLATAPKSNSTLGFFDALESVKKEREGDVPNHLKDSNRDKDTAGHGQGYLYPHAFRDHWVAQQYLPENLQGQVFYQPSSQGYEASIQQTVSRRREAQLAAQFEGASVAPPEVLTFGPQDPIQERWFQRTQSQVGERLGRVRDKLFASLPTQRHHVFLDLRAESGLLTWEALRSAPEGGTYARVSDTQAAEDLGKQAQLLPELQRPQALVISLQDLSSFLEKQHPDLRFDAIVGYNALVQEKDKASQLLPLRRLLRPQGSLALAEAVPRRTQRLYKLLEPDWLDEETLELLKKAEESIYDDPNDPKTNWDVEQLVDALQDWDGTLIWESVLQEAEVCLTEQVLQRWFPTEYQPRSYETRLRTFLSNDQVALVKRLFSQRLSGQTIPWSSTTLFLRLSV